jgi:hypothetical protein
LPGGGGVDLAFHRFAGLELLPTVIAKSPSDEAIQTASAKGFWIAALRSQ